MIDPGHPFSVQYKDLIEAFEERIRDGVEQPDRARFTFKSSVLSYELPRTAYAILQVSGRMGANFTVFQAGSHYRFSNNRIIWIHPTEFPDEGTRLEVEYTYRERPAGLTDFNPGSVVGTLIRAVSREMKLIYEQMDQAYRRAFIDQATGVALDNVVALLGIERNPDIHAIGHVTFYRKKASTTSVLIEEKTRVTDESDRSFVTTEAGEIEPVRIEFDYQLDGLINVKNKIAELEGIWLRSGDPENDTPFDIKDTETDYPYGEDERTITLADDVRPTEELQIRYKPKSVTVAIKAEKVGPEGNVNAGTIVIMPTPPIGIDGVVNEEPTSEGKSAEPDDQLRERAKHALERSGNATINAIKYAVLDVDGVEGVEVVDFNSGENIPLGEVRVRFSGGDAEQVAKVVDLTRAAGVMARLEVINTVFILGTFYVIPDLTVPAAASQEFLTGITEALDALTIGQPLSVRRLNAMVFNIAGLADVAEAQLQFKKKDLENPDDFIVGPVSDPFLIESSELIRPDTSNLKVTLLGSLKAKRKEGENLQIDVWIEDATGNTIHFKNYAVNINVTLMAYLLDKPDLPPERIGLLKQELSFSDASIALLTIDPGSDEINFDSDKHAPTVQVLIKASAYPGLKTVEDVTVDFS
ncbi:hypothetical protein EH223_19285 [candidate division KSB1 bacterium]|nr:baseplate J/gp47 family protein [candidate division KSB1 bacterium]RQW00094.1 MAG: hypothetical protein EH223_19285 [candidate division KSB1 bacterium]